MNPHRDRAEGGDATPAPVLVLGVGNLLLRDDGVGLRLLDQLASDPALAGSDVEFVDGGTQGLMLLGRMSKRPAMLLLDAVSRGASPGTVHAFDGGAALANPGGEGDTAHEGGAGTLLALARLTGDLPRRVAVVGVEPACVETGVGLSPEVESAMDEAATRAREALAGLRAAIA